MRSARIAAAMQQIVHRPARPAGERGRAPVRIDEGDRKRTGASAAVVRHASARDFLEGMDADALTAGQHVARWTITVVAIAIASALFALQIHATLH